MEELEINKAANPMDQLKVAKEVIFPVTEI